MNDKNNYFEETKEILQNTKTDVSRRRFLTYAGLSATVVAAASCQKVMQVVDSINPKDLPQGMVDLGSGDVGILNYAYALEQLESAFYIRVTQSFYSGVTAKEKSYLESIRDHEITHREFFKNALGDNAIGTLLMNFSSVNFESRASVLGTAKALEDVGVSAYNGAGELLQNPSYLLLAGKIVSVEARHAAALRDLLNYGTFADNSAVNAMGLDLYRKPPEVLQIASTYITTKINASNLPTS